MLNQRPLSANTSFSRHNNYHCDPEVAKRMRLSQRPSTSDSRRDTPEFFANTRVRSCSRIILVDGKPKAVVFPESRASHSAAKDRRLSLGVHKVVLNGPSSIYQYFLIKRTDYHGSKQASVQFRSQYKKPLMPYSPNSFRSLLPDYTVPPNLKYMQNLKIGNPVYDWTQPAKEAKAPGKQSTERR
jgi:hypothetical protein